MGTTDVSELLPMMASHLPRRVAHSARLTRHVEFQNDRIRTRRSIAAWLPPTGRQVLVDKREPAKHSGRSCNERIRAASEVAKAREASSLWTPHAVSLRASATLVCAWVRLERHSALTIVADK